REIDNLEKPGVRGPRPHPQHVVDLPHARTTRRGQGDVCRSSTLRDQCRPLSGLRSGQRVGVDGPAGPSLPLRLPPSAPEHGVRRLGLQWHCLFDWAADVDALDGKERVFSRDGRREKRLAVNVHDPWRRTLWRRGNLSPGSLDAKLSGSPCRLGLRTDRLPRIYLVLGTDTADGKQDGQEDLPRGLVRRSTSVGGHADESEGLRLFRLDAWLELKLGSWFSPATQRHRVYTPCVYRRRTFDTALCVRLKPK
ncbi:hypothetical protein CTA2_10240, partial [Colletotrichum tanaceti]